MTTDDGSDDSGAAPAVPLLTVVRGEPTPEQLAALVAVVAARASGDEGSDEPAAPSLWASPQLRTPLAAGPGAWLASGLPTR